MTNLIHISVTPEIQRNPFLFLWQADLPANLSIPGKAQYIKDFCVLVQSFEDESEKVLTRNHWLNIVNGFGAVATIGGSMAMAPLAGLLVSGAAVVAAITAIADSYLTKSKIEPISETLTRHRIALESQKTIHWAALWEIAGTELFCKAVSYSARGFLSEGKLVQQGQDSPFVRAADYAAESLGATYDAVIDAIDLAIAGRQAPQLQRQYAPNLPPVTQSLPPVTPRQHPGSFESVPTQQIGSTPLAFERSVKPASVARSAYTLILDNPFQSLAIFGAQRTGKSYLAAILSQELHRRGIPVYVINLARFGEEDDIYWCHCSKAVLGDISSMSAYEASQLIKEAVRTVNEFYAQPKAILIFDEWAYAGNKDNAHAEALEPLLKLVSDKLGTLTSTGIKRGKAIWTIAPEFVAGSLQKPALAIKKSALLYVSIAPGEFVEWRGNRIGFNAELFSQVKNNYSVEKPEGIFNQERICFINNEWIEMGELPPLDPTLRPTVATQSQPVPQQQSATVSSDYSEEEKKAAEAFIVASLRTTHFHTLWEFARDELGAMSSEEIKKILEGIAGLIFDYDLTELKDKFRLSSKYSVRYSYAGYSKKVAATHRKTGNICALCHQNQSEEAHHIEYLGIEDEPGKNLFPLCLPCHKEVAHNRENWQQLSIWKSRNTPEFEARLKLEYQFALVEGEAA